MLEDLETVLWQAVPQPNWNVPNEVPEALRSIVRIDSDQDAERAYNRLLYAVGNNHSGTYYPVVLWAIPFVAEMLRHDKSLVRETALDILIDLTASFEPERGFETIYSPSGQQVSLRSAVRDAVVGVRPLVEACATAAVRDSREHQISQKLLSIIG